MDKARAALFGTLAHTVYRRLEWLELALADERPGTEARVPLEHGFLDAASVGEITALRTGLDAAETDRRFERGDRCFGSRWQGELVSVTWLAAPVARIDYLGLALRLPPGAVYQYDRWTEERRRGLRIAPAAGSRLQQALRDQGFETLTATVLTENRAAMTNALRVGLRPVATIGWIGVGPLRRTFRRPH